MIIAANTRPRDWRAAVYWTALGLILLVALFLRTAALDEVQRFYGDQGRDYMEVMRWLQEGHWPRLGPGRSIGKDFNLGPGWYYTIAPALALSGFHPAAGAATVAVLATLTMLLLADWLRRATGSHAAALVTAAVMACSAPWIDQGRTLWNPHALPLGVAALAWLIAWVPRRPLPALAAAAALLALLPQWHTLGLLVGLAALPALALTAWRAGPALRAAPRRAWLGWGLVLLAVLVLLYVPPLLYEWEPGPGNLRSFFVRSALPPAPYSGPWHWRLLDAFDRLAGGLAYQAFLNNPLTDPPWLRLPLAGALAAAFLAFFARDLRRRQADLAAGYLALLTAGFWLLLVLKGESVKEYYLGAVQMAMLMLAGWTAGRLLTAAPAMGTRFRLKPLAGLVLLLLAGFLSLAQLPRAWAIHNGITPYGYNLLIAGEVADFIAGDAGGHPYSLELAEENNFPGHYFYLLRRRGRPPRNTDYQRHAIARERMGERIYIIVGPGMRKYPALKGLVGPLPEPGQVRNIYIYRIEAAILPPATRDLKVAVEGKSWTLEAVQARQ